MIQQQQQHSWSKTTVAVVASVLLVAVFSANGVLGAQNNYYGKYIGKLKTLHHGVTGEVYAVDGRTLHIRDFSYDGEGPAAYFYAGDSKSPNGFGFRVNDENGSPNVLSRYRKKHITLTLPDSKTLRDIKWFSVWCDEFSVNFGDVRIPKNLDFPKPQKIDALNGVHKVSSDNIVIVDAQTLLIPNFSYDGEAPDAKFWVGRGNKPSPQGVRVPDENGKEDPLRRYDRKTIVLTLPKDMTVQDIGHFGVWCEAFTVDFGHIRVPRNLNVPPSLKMLGVSPQKRPRSLQQFQLPLEQQLVQQNTFSGGVVADARSNFPRRYNEQTNPTLDTAFYNDESQLTSHLDDSRYTQQIQATTYKPTSHRRLSARTRQTTTAPLTNNNNDDSYQIIPSISLTTDQFTNQQQYPNDQLRNYNTGSQQYQNGRAQNFDNGFVDSSSSLNPSTQNYFSNSGSFSSRQLTNDFYQEQPIQRRRDSSVDGQTYRNQQIQRRRDYTLDRQAANDYYREQPSQSRRDNYRDRQSVNDFYSEQQAIERHRDDVQRSSRRFGRNSAADRGTQFQ